jgi:hypothetical protein
MEDQRNVHATVVDGKYKELKEQQQRAQEVQKELERLRAGSKQQQANNIANSHTKTTGLEFFPLSEHALPISCGILLLSYAFFCYVTIKFKIPSVSTRHLPSPTHHV